MLYAATASPGGAVHVSVTVFREIAAARFVGAPTTAAAASRALPPACVTSAAVATTGGDNASAVVGCDGSVGFVPHAYATPQIAAVSAIRLTHGPRLFTIWLHLRIDHADEAVG